MTIHAPRRSFDDFESLARELVARPSMSSVNPRWDHSNREVIELLHDWFGDLGMRVETREVPGYPGKFNLLARTGPQRPGGLVLSGHTDTVPFDERGWHSDPFVLQLREGRYHGLGSSDMKLFFVLVAQVLGAMDLRRLQRPLLVVATADEESSMCGIESFDAADLHGARHVLIGEPTDLRPIRMHKGIAMESIRFTGLSGHSSDPGSGNSALEGMYLAIGEILRWREELARRYAHPAFAVPAPTLNLGHIHGGDNPNRICGQCELQIDLRPTPGLGLTQLREDLHARMRAVARQRRLEVEIVPLFRGIEAMETPPDSPLVRVAERLSGRSAGAVSFATEAPFFQAMGIAPVVFGPGSIRQAHQVNEYIEATQLQPFRDALRGLVDELCTRA
jgi:acetylornithine deacetylase